jgi:flagellar hook assembly protein FlgD
MIAESDRMAVMRRTVEWFGSTTGVEAPGATPRIVSLAQNVPNPFGLSTSISFNLGDVSPVRLRVYDVHGRLVRNLVDGDEDWSAHSAIWDGTDDRGRDLASGVYFYRLETDGVVETRRMVLSR